MTMTKTWGTLPEELPISKFCRNVQEWNYCSVSCQNSLCCSSDKSMIYRGLCQLRTTNSYTAESMLKTMLKTQTQTQPKTMLKPTPNHYYIWKGGFKQWMRKKADRGSEKQREMVGHLGTYVKESKCLAKHSQRNKGHFYLKGNKATECMCAPFDFCHLPAVSALLPLCWSFVAPEQYINELQNPFFHSEAYTVR